MTTIAQYEPDDNDRRVLEGERLFLRVLLAAPNGIATLAEATPAEYRDQPFPDGGRWRGTIPKRLAGRGIVAALIAPDGRLESHRSPRTTRRRGVAVVWKLIDEAAARRRLCNLDELLSNNPSSHPRQPGLFDDSDDSTADSTGT